jgi:hypothetical protein
MADMSLPTFGGRDPMAVSPGRIMPNVLLVSTLQVSDPIQILIQVKADDFPGLTLALSFRFHDRTFRFEQTKGRALHFLWTRAQQLRLGGCAALMIRRLRPLSMGPRRSSRQTAEHV